jgi:hypothetical protein
MRFIIWLACQIGAASPFKWKLWWSFRKNPLPLINVFTGKYFQANNNIYFNIFNHRRCIVFYEKSILSMIGYLYGKRFEVIQHGNPTATYWPSVANIYYSWSTGYKEQIKKNYSGEVRICGYPGTISLPAQFKAAKFDILFLSQYGSSPELIDECYQVKQYINELSARGFRIVVKLHPRECQDNLVFASGVVIAGKMESLEDLFCISTSVCSYYSTALLLAARSECPVFRVAVGSKIIEDDFPFLSEIPVINTADTQVNPLTIAKKIKTDIMDFDYHALE